MEYINDITIYNLVKDATSRSKYYSGATDEGYCVR